MSEKTCPANWIMMVAISTALAPCWRPAECQTVDRELPGRLAAAERVDNHSGAINTRIAVDSRFPGGAVRVVSIDQESQRLVFDNALGAWSWWYFKVSGIDTGRPLHLRTRARLLRKDPDVPWGREDSFLVTQMVWSANNRDWRLTPEGQLLDFSGDERPEWVEYTLDPGVDTAWFAIYPPYVLEDAQSRLRLAEQAGSGANVFELARSQADRPVPALRVREGDRPDRERIGIWLQARQHPWEISGSWVVQGFMDWLLSDAADARSLRFKSEIVLVPIMNVDGVQGGEIMSSVNSNRQWHDASACPEVRGAQRAIRELHGRTAGVRLFLDLHNYAYRGNEAFSFWFRRKAAPFDDETVWEKTALFRQTIETLSGPPYRVGFWEPPAVGSREKPYYASDWAFFQCRPCVAFTLENAMVQAGTVPDAVPQDHLERGALLGRAVARFFAEW